MTSRRRPLPRAPTPGPPWVGHQRTILSWKIWPCRTTSVRREEAFWRSGVVLVVSVPLGHGDSARSAQIRGKEPIRSLPPDRPRFRERLQLSLPTGPQVPTGKLSKEVVIQRSLSSQSPYPRTLSQFFESLPPALFAVRPLDDKSIFPSRALENNSVCLAPDHPHSEDLVSGNPDAVALEYCGKNKTIIDRVTELESGRSTC
jgi:hypothetical protein